MKNDNLEIFMSECSLLQVQQLFIEYREALVYKLQAVQNCSADSDILW